MTVRNNGAPIGVALLLFALINGVHKLFVVKELVAKPQYAKQAGMLSFPIETYQQEDNDYLGTVTRAIEEEIGISHEHIEIESGIFAGFHLIPERNDIETVYVVGHYKGDPGVGFSPKDSDVEFAGWFSIVDLLAYPSIRIEVPPILRHYVSGISPNFV